ncbi:hypothetical protein [Longispora albida]|uniref:hypothetical protein n=1 Tax=Longispora albida TaxID=203523 RepID=UPI000368F600|nr:hypothetical protein [Longispora albida]
MRRRLLALGTALTLALASLTVPAGPAQAAVGDLACTGAAQATFTPALTSGGTVAVSATGTLTGCVSVNGAYTQLKSATLTASGTATAAPGLNPCTLVLTITLTGTLTWTPTGQQSGISAVLNTNLATGSAAVSIQVNTGPLAGDTGTEAPVVTPNLDCLFNGLNALNATLVVFSFN